MKAWLMTLAVTAVTWTAAGAKADDLSWNYFDADYVYSEVGIDGDNVDLDGGNFEGSLGFSKAWMLRGSYATSELSFDGLSASADLATAGVAYRFALVENLNIAVGGGYTYAEAEAVAEVGNVFLLAKGDSHGGYLEGRLRGRIAKRFEAEATVVGVYFGDDFFEEDVIFGVKGRFYITPLVAVAIGVSGSKEADDPSFSLGLRLQGVGFGG